MEARVSRAAIIAVVLFVSMGARHRSANFIVESPDAAYGKQVSQAAEKFRHDLAVMWLGRAMPDWSQPCVLTVRTGPNLGAGGATTFVFDRGEVFGWRMSIQGSRRRILDSVLPHEITHMIFASHFRQPLPRWADEGGATSVEHISERTKYRKMLYRFLQTGRGISFNRMFAMRDYPRDVMPLYAQGYSVAEYLIRQHGHRKYIEFIGDGLKTNDWSGAIRRTYGLADAGVLQNSWLAWVRQGSPPIQPRQDHPAIAAKDELLASAGRRERPEPNLIYRDPAKQDRPIAVASAAVVPVAAARSPSYAPGSVIPAGASSSNPIRLASHTAAAPRQLPSSGWHAMGTRAAAPPVAAAANSTTGQGASNQVARPQPIQRPRQVILEWSGR